MIEELSQCMNQVTGPTYFIENFVYVQHPTKGRVPFKLYPYQYELCDVYHNYRNSIAMVSRQMGKSVLASAYLLWFAMFNPDSTILIAAHKYLGAQEIMQRLRFAYESVPDHIRCGVTSYNKGSVEFDNGSRVIAQTTTENTGRGMSISCVRTDKSIVTVRDKETDEIKKSTIRELIKLSNEERIEKNKDLSKDVALTKNTKYEVLTIKGFKDFGGITVALKSCVLLTTKKYQIECTPDHEFFSIDGNCWKSCDKLLIGENIRTECGSDTITGILETETHAVSDLINVQDTQSFIANGIDVHNCAYLDEFAFVRPTIAREFWTSLSPTLSTGGKVIITSTPNQDDNQFAELWFGSQKTIDEYGNEQDIGANGFKGYLATWESHPERDEEWARVEFEKIGSDRFKREHLCEFVSYTETLISGAKLLQLEHEQPIRKTGQVRWYEPIKDKKIYTITLDPSMGTGGDYSAIQVLELPSLKQVAEWRHNKTRIEDQLKVLKSIAIEIQETAPKSEIYWTVENNSIGEACLVAIREQDEETFPGTFMHDPKRKSTGIKRKGYNTTNQNKLEACAKLKHLVENDRISIKSKSLIHELKYFIAKGNSYSACAGETDDLVMSLLVNIRMSQHISQWEEGLENMMDYRFSDDEEFDNEPMPVIV